MTSSRFPVLDAPRHIANADYQRMVVDSFGDVEPFIEETDSWVAMPLRLVHDSAAGWRVELGPYSLDRRDIGRLREALAAYDSANSPSSQKGIADD
ncbi:hypothetical protein MHAE_04395 [Mycobacterium haemophilum DSM 44634]|uniref:hypothetical protein n=1 Tax=Mycobacterium haemophilum TaxID=29311 RepID=UPI0006566074|nr:hypothetical protein [Mycobacterium haemophilum]AKN17471.1 hypothetical protein B586_14250 [Mycobacterium haemophilum DSM 44634]MCV7341594.1 hypothetical protein [Mycobacterium haemophilum DSM 44634]